MSPSSSAKRLIAAIAIFAAPFTLVGACGGSNDDSLGANQPDAATDDAAIVDSSVSPDDANDTGIIDGSRVDASLDAGVFDAAKAQNRCGGYAELDYAGHIVTPGDSCGGCSDGTIACVGSNAVECAGASTPPCPTPPVDAGPNECGGYATLTFMAVPASLGDSCGECGTIECATADTLFCAAGYAGSCATDAGLASACTIPASAYSASSVAPTLPAETRPTSTTTLSIGLESNALAYNPHDGYLYASVSSYVTSQGNSIAIIDPISATVLTTIYVGSQPTTLALSDDGQVLWVYLSGSRQIRRVDLVTRTAGLTITLAPSTSVYDLEVLPAAHDSIAVATYQYPYPYAYAGYALVVYDNGIARPYGASLEQVTQGLVTSSPSLIVTTAPSYTAIDNVCADSKGVFPTVYGTTLNNGGYSYDWSTAIFSNGQLYVADGHAYDAKTGTLLNSFNYGSTSSSPVMTIDAQDVYFLTSSYRDGNYWLSVTGFDRSTAVSTAPDLLLVNAGINGPFLRWGRYGFAFLNNSNIVIARSTIIPDSP